MSKYRKKPVEVEAVQWTGTNKEEIDNFVGDSAMWLHDLVYRPHDYEEGYILNIQTLEGTMRAKVGDYIIKGVNGEFYPCKPDIFEKTYEKIYEQGIYGFPTEAGVEIVLPVTKNIPKEMGDSIRRQIENANRFNPFNGKYE